MKGAQEMNRMTRLSANENNLKVGEMQTSRCGGRTNTRGCNVCNTGDLARKLAEIDFAIYDTVLYLDAYPHCSEALNYYHKLCDARRTLAAEYERSHGPITAFGNHNHGVWEWTASPWPWQK